RKGFWMDKKFQRAFNKLGRTLGFTQVYLSFAPCKTSSVIQPHISFQIGIMYRATPLHSTGEADCSNITNRCRRPWRLYIPSLIGKEINSRMQEGHRRGFGRTKRTSRQSSHRPNKG